MFNLIKKTVLISVITLGTAHAVVAPETLYVDKSDDLSLDQNGNPKRKFLITNSINDGFIRISSNLESLSEVFFKLKCEGKQSRYDIVLPDITNDIRIPKDTKQCDLLFTKDKGIRLIRDEVAFPYLKAFHQTQEACRYQTNSDSHIDQMFLTNDYTQMSCIHESGDIELLKDSKQALLSKIEVLLGKRLSEDFIDHQNPYAELDFSNAPKLDAIFISTLLYRHDFTGAVMARLVEFHAKRGTLVNIMGTGYMHNEKDQSLFKKLTKASSNIRIQEYKYHESNLLKKAKVLTNKLRDMHLKLFVTLSKENPKNNMVIMGGRNIHDGFVFQEKPDFSKYPELNQVDQNADYAYWKDLEIKVTSTELSRSVYNHLLKFWNRDVKTQEMPSINKDSRLAKSTEEIQFDPSSTMIRHFMSLPFNDNHALEKLYVDMIDNAQKSIKISSPYLRPTKPIMTALKRALKRNKDMEIIIQTRIDLAGDTQAWLYEETNKKAINELFDKVKIYEWMDNSILHTKLLIIDDSFTFIGSVNLSQRSFIQDVESGFMVRSKNFNEEISSLFDSYNQRSRLITKAQKRRFWGSLISELFKTQF